MSNKNIEISKIIDKAHALGMKELLPNDEEVAIWFDETIDNDSASSAIYKFRLWLKDRSKQLSQ